MNLPKIFLAGYPGSQKIVPITKYLLNKYLPSFEVVFINYTGKVEGWGKFFADYFDKISDKYLIFSLDDFFISQPIDMALYAQISMQDAICVKLCECSEEDNKSFPITCQYSLWDRGKLVEFLKLATGPWNFEMKLSAVINQMFSEKTVEEFGRRFKFYPVLKYDTKSALSKKWQGINWDGLNPVDKNNAFLILEKQRV